MRSGGLDRALGGAVRTSLDALLASTAAQYEQCIQGLIAAAQRAGKLRAGIERVRKAIRAGEVQLLVVAGDAAGGGDELRAVAQRLGRRCIVHGTRQDLGRLLGREQVAMLAVLATGLASEIALASDRRALLTGSDGRGPEAPAGSAESA
ncbi:MAG: ribosomal L7Ae/L30e/S12e/Gadd45 family protein [Proteobacteria bacterium]|nr:ribosomal L7Ae/L30e/S12e/Gadd45 family protein [Pseudomonadota bacterium]